MSLASSNATGDTVSLSSVSSLVHNSMVYTMKTSVQIANELFSNLSNGGGTVWLGTEYSTGYVVALPNHELRIDNACLRPNVIQFYVENLIQLGADGVGFWVDGDKTYIDSVIHITNRDVAVKLGREYNQLAVYCLDTNEVIDL